MQLDWRTQSPQPSQTSSLITRRSVGSSSFAARAQAALFGRALLVVDDDGDAGNLFQFAQDIGQVVAVAQFGIARPG